MAEKEDIGSACSRDKNYVRTKLTRPDIRTLAHVGGLSQTGHSHESRFFWGLRTLLVTDS